MNSMANFHELISSIFPFDVLHLYHLFWASCDFVALNVEGNCGLRIVSSLLVL